MDVSVEGSNVFLDITGRVRANSFTGSLEGFATSGSIVQVWDVPGTYSNYPGQSGGGTQFGYTPPSWAKRITVIAVGAGGGGGGGSSHQNFLR